MNGFTKALLLFLLGNANGCDPPFLNQAATSPKPTISSAAFTKESGNSAPPASPPNGPFAIYSNTMAVEALAGQNHVLWVATRGGLEQYDVIARKRMTKYTTQDGLPALFVESVSLNADGIPQVTTAKQRCVMHRKSRRFACFARTSTAIATPAAKVNERIEGSPVTARWVSNDGAEWLGTAGRGLWVRDVGKLERVTPGDQITGNHVVAIAEWNGANYFATFDQGLSRLYNGKFTAISLDSQMLNDVIATPRELFVATSKGIYRSTDGELFIHESRVTESTISDLAYDVKRRMLYATATNSLWELPLDQSAKKPRSVYLPGGSRSLQAVDVSEDGTVYLASEDRGVIRRDNKGHFTNFDRLSGYPTSWAIDVLALDKNTALFASLRHGVFPVGTDRDDDVGGFEPWTLFLGRDSRDSGALFLGTQDGAWIVKTQSSQRLDGLPNPCVHSIARLPSGLWVGTEGGLAQYP